MNNRTRASIIGYIGTTISLMKNEHAWKAAKELAVKDINDIDAFMQTLTEETREELEPLVNVIRNPRLLTNNDAAAQTDQVRKFIFEQIGIHAEATLANPPPPETERTIESISAEIQQRHAAMRVSPVTGNDRLNSTAVPPHDIAWFTTPEGQAFLFGTSSQQETDEFRAALNAGIRQAFDARSLVRNLLAPDQDIMYQTVSPWLPQNYYVQTSVWWFTAALSFMGTAGMFIRNINTAGYLTAIGTMLEQGVNSFQAENRRALRQPVSSLWANPVDQRPPANDNDNSNLPRP
jgi:hypothetical protein